MNTAFEPAVLSVDDEHVAVGHSNQKGYEKRQWVLIATHKDDDPVSVPPFDAITFALDDLWP